MAAPSSGRHAGDDHDDRVTPLSGTQLIDLRTRAHDQFSTTPAQNDGFRAAGVS
jgi:hypothetical protein